MRAATLLLLLFTANTFTTRAQPPVIRNAEAFTIGTVLRFQECATTGITPGQAGPGQTWDFSGLKAGSEVSTEWMVAPKTTPYAADFPKASFVEKYSNGSYVYVNSTAERSYLTGYADSAHQMRVSYSDEMLFARRPVAFGDRVTDSFASATQMQGTTFNSTGTFTMEADGWGKLILPNGTYNNALRLKLTNKMLMGGGAGELSTTTYVWFDGKHTSALLKMESTQSAYYNNESVEYLLSETAGK